MFYSNTSPGLSFISLGNAEVLFTVVCQCRVIKRVSWLLFFYSVNPLTWCLIMLSMKVMSIGSSNVWWWEIDGNRWGRGARGKLGGTLLREI